MKEKKWLASKIPRNKVTELKEYFNSSLPLFLHHIYIYIHISKDSTDEN